VDEFDFERPDFKDLARLNGMQIHFFGQIELNAPTYVIKTENDAGSVNTYMPGAMAQIGVIF